VIIPESFTNMFGAFAMRSMFSAQPSICCFAINGFAM
jgi:hypothetical protein